MNHSKIYALALAGLAFAACDDVDELAPEGGALTAAQVKEAVDVIPNRGEASFAGMFSMMGEPEYTFAPAGSHRADDFGFIMMAISQDAEGADLNFPNSGYNWFSPCGELTTRDPGYANPRLRYAMPYNHIGVANELIKSYNGATEGEGLNKLAQARAIRAFDYLALAPYFQFSYEKAKDELCVPIVTEAEVDFANNPRATVAEVYDLIIADLNFAVENLTDKRSDKSKINKNVALGLRARAYLNMGKYAEAAADAEAAMVGFEPASIAEVSVPTFYDINEHNWIWGIVVTDAQALISHYATSCSWINSFSSDGYSAATDCYASINNILYDKISDTDVRKGWWLNENGHSDNIANCSWRDADGKDHFGDDLVSLVIKDVKKAMHPFNNVKFGLKSGIGTETNNNDWPTMRVEEMILVAAEGYAKSGNEAKAKEILVDFVTKYRDPAYTIPTNRSLADEIWFQRRVELWGEGFFMSDRARLNKPLVRITDKASALSEAFQFNVDETDPWLLMRFPLKETNSNLAIVNNTGGVAPVPGQNAELRDGVTD